jgi:cell division protease FtsH
MVTRFGMSERLGNLTYGKPTSGRFLQSPFTAEERNYSDRTAELIDDEVQRLISEAYDLSRGILTGRHAQLERIAEELILKETLDRAELDRLVNESTQKEATALSRKG